MSSPKTPLAKFKASVRSHAGVYQRLGKLVKRPCIFCNGEDAEKHHPNYLFPLEVMWVCRACHAWAHRVGIFREAHSLEFIAEEWYRRLHPPTIKEMAHRVAFKNLMRKHVKALAAR